MGNKWTTPGVLLSLRIFLGHLEILEGNVEVL